LLIFIEVKGSVIFLTLFMIHVKVNVDLCQSEFYKYIFAFSKLNLWKAIQR